MISSSASRCAKRYGVAHYPAVLRKPLVALGMARENGLPRTLAQIRTVALIRALGLMEDARLKRRFPACPEGVCGFDPALVRPSRPEELTAAVHCEPIPAFTLRRALRGLGIDLGRRHFVDVGSGWGYALRVAAEFPFPSLTGIEFAGELHDAARRNFEAFGRDGSVAAGRVGLRNESALDAELPDGPLLLLLFNPFGEAVLRPFLDRVDQSHRDRPRPVTALYVNPAHRHLFDRPHIRERALRQPAKALLDLFSPNAVRAYDWAFDPARA